MRRTSMGTVTAPSGMLAIFDMGYASMWESGIDAPRVSTDHGPIDVPESADFRIVGGDAVEAGRRFNRQPGIWLYDIPVDHVEGFKELFAEHTRGLDARLERESGRIDLLERARRAAAAKAGSFLMGGIGVAVVGGLDPTAEFNVFMDFGDWGPDVGQRPRDVTIVINPERDVVSSHELGDVMVDWARLMIVDPSVMSLWRHDEALDGRADLVFWGRDAEEAASATDAGLLPEGVYGWIDLPIGETPQEVERLREWGSANPDKLVRVDYRPHSHHWELIRQATGAESGTIALGDARVMGFFTEWGDGIFPVLVDRAADGSPVAIRIRLGDDDRADRMRQVLAR